MHQHIFDAPLSVRVPATSANIGPGFDCLALALSLYNTYTITVAPSQTEPVTFTYTTSWGPDAAITALADATENLFYTALVSRLRQHDCTVPSLHVDIAIGIPPGRGLGSSATAVVGGIVAADAIAGKGHPGITALPEAIALEHGQHGDNVAAALLGGLAVVACDTHSQQWHALKMPVPPQLRAVLFVPAFPMDTVAGRALLPERYLRKDCVHNVSHVALLLAALTNGDLTALNAAIDDRFHEPYRAEIFPQLPELLTVARAAGAHGACLSGGGSSILTLASDNANEIVVALTEAATTLHIEGRVIVLDIDHQGATVQQSGDFKPHLACPTCQRTADLHQTDYRCQCGNPFDVAMDAAVSNHAGPQWQQKFDQRLTSFAPEDVSGVWRFRDIIMPIPEIVPVTRMEGQTHLYPVGKDNSSGGHSKIGDFAGIQQMWVKHEGENPTGSFKDRGMTVGVSVARWLGASAVACASTGNTSAAMAAYAAQAGLRAIVLLPAGKVATGKLGQALAYGAEIRQIAGDFDKAMADVERMCLDEGIYLLNSLNPFRIQGQQSLAFELAQQFSWNVPDWIVLPAGNLGNTSALGMGLLAAYERGIISRLPRIASIQAAGANPFYTSYLDKFAQLTPVAAKTIATAINIGNPVSFLRAKHVIQATNGVVAQVSDEEILQAKAVIDRAGIGCEPASAAAVAGARQLVAAGIIRSDERVVSVLTGNLLKDPDAIALAQAAGKDILACW